jgi:hypothetical protein
MKVLSSCFSNMRYRVLLILAGLLLFVIYFPYFNEDFFLIDDSSLVSIPQFQNCSLRNFFSGFLVPGYHIDFYPLRELSYMFDRCLTGFNYYGLSGTWYRVHNLLLFLGSVLFLFESLKKLKIKENIAFFSMLIVLWNPFFNESYLWITARKDILAVFFMTASVYFFLKAMEVRRNKFFYFSLMFYAFSLLSKATFVLLPLTFLVLFHLKKNKLEKRFVFIASVIGFLWAVFQSHFYSSYNNMSYNYDLTYRLKASLITLSRIVGGVFWDALNSIDVCNWGEWVELNKKFIFPGVLIFGFLIGLFFIFLKKKKKFPIFVFILAGMLWAPISGLIFHHRNFYSTRYYLPVVIWLLPLILIFFISSVKNVFLKNSLMVFFVLFFLSQTFWSARVKWDSNKDVLKYSLSLAPQNYANQTFLAEEFINQKRWGRLLDSNEISSLRNILSNLNKTCLYRANTDSTLCSVFFRLAAFGKIPLSFEEVDKKILINENLLRSYLSFLEASVKKHVPKDEEKIKFNTVIYLLPLKYKVNFEYDLYKIPPGALSEPESRVHYLFALCLNSPQKTNLFLKKMVEQGLVYKSNIEDNISKINNEDIKKQLILCFKNYYNQKLSFNN